MLTSYCMLGEFLCVDVSVVYYHLKLLSVSQCLWIAMMWLGGAIAKRGGLVSCHFITSLCKILLCCFSNGCGLLCAPYFLVSFVYLCVDALVVYMCVSGSLCFLLFWYHICISVTELSMPYRSIDSRLFSCCHFKVLAQHFATMNPYLLLDGCSHVLK